MNRILSIKFDNRDRKVFLVLSVCVLLFITFTLLQDALRSGINNSAFYFSESLLYSSFWWLFAPLLFAQYYAVNITIKKPVFFYPALIVCPAIIHVLAFPFLVWLLSAALYDHTYTFQQILNYTLSEHVYNIAVLYTIPVVLYQFIFKRSVAPAVLPGEKKLSPGSYMDSILVTDGNKRSAVAVTEILYFSASPPYISIHTREKKFLQQQTLKSISCILDPAQFIRIHRSAIVNIKMVESYITRLNGDYDLSLSNNIKLRLSRNYAADFKILFNKTHQLTTK